MVALLRGDEGDEGDEDDEGDKDDEEGDEDDEHIDMAMIVSKRDSLIVLPEGIR